MRTKKKLQDNTNDNKPASARTQEIQEQIGTLGRRDLHLFVTSMFLLVVMALGILASAYPNLRFSSKALQTDGHLLPQLFLGLMTLIVLFSVYVVMEKRDLGKTRQRLVEELLFNQRVDAVSMIDPTTQLFTRNAMDQMVAHEISRTIRIGSPLSLLILDICDFEKISSHLSTLEIERFLYDSAQLVKTTLRASDLVFRYKETQFLVLMPDTNEQQVDFALARLQNEIDRQNADFRRQAELAFTHGVAEFAQGSRITDTLLAAERKVFLNKYSFTPLVS